MQPVIGELDMVTDGEKEGGDGYFVELGPGKQWVQIDLGSTCALHAILAWHYHSQARVYRDVIVQVSNDKDFLKGVTTVFNNDHDNSPVWGWARTRSTSRWPRAACSTPRARRGATSGSTRAGTRERPEPLRRSGGVRHAGKMSRAGLLAPRGRALGSDRRWRSAGA
jgi:hypothetical protein